mmetsp:Transcript_2620/g.5088  ORF Transcript_2620/g.5088 Transcript_2620/m.5088 type:complete len:516 (+) Transcript_2620:328-1875(+)
MEARGEHERDGLVPLLRQEEREGQGNVPQQQQEEQGAGEDVVRDLLTNAGESRGGCFNVRPSVWVLLPAIFLCFVGNALMFALMPVIQASWFTKCEQNFSMIDDISNSSSSNCKPDYEAAQAVNGVVDSLSSLFSFFAAALVGRLSDVYGRRRIIALGMAGTSAPLIALFLTRAQSPFAFYGTTLVAAFFGCSGRSFLGVVCMAYISDTSLPKDLPLRMGIFTASITITMILNPLLGHLTANLALQEIMLLNLVLVACAILYTMIVLPESLPDTKRNKFEWGRTMNPMAPLQLLAHSRIMRWVSLIYFLASGAEAGVAEIALNYVDQVLGLSGQSSADFNRLLMATIGVSMLFANTVLLQSLLKFKVSPVTLFAMSQIGSVCRIGIYILLGFFPVKALILINGFPTMFLALMSVSCNTLVSANMGSQEQGFALGTLSAMGVIGDVINPVIFSELFAYFGHNYDLPEVPFILGLLSASMSLLLALFGPLRSILADTKRAPEPSHSVACMTTGSEQA